MPQTLRIIIATTGFALLAFAYYAWYVHKSKSDDDTIELLGFFALMGGVLAVLGAASAP